MNKPASKAQQIRQLLVVGVVVLIGKIKLTRWTAPRPVTKQLRLSANGSIEKISTASQLYEGKVTRLECSPQELVKTLAGVGPNDCLSFGVPLDDAASEILSRSKFAALGEPASAMTRTCDAMTWLGGPAILMIDHDYDNVRYTANDLLKVLYECCPPMQQAAHVWGASTSSCVWNSKTKKELRGIEGQRVYVVVADGRDIPRAASVLFKRTWLAGRGNIKISKSGSLLERSILDATVFQPNRIDYCAPAMCEPPLVQKKPKHVLHGDVRLALDTRAALPDLSAAEQSQYEQLVSAAQNQQRGAAAAIKASYQQARVDAYTAKGMDPVKAEKIVTAAQDNHVLHADFVLTAEDGRLVTVTQLLLEKSTWHGVRFADPIEPDYHGDHRIARAYLEGPARPHIQSFARGSHRYQLSHTTEIILLRPGDRSEYMQKMVNVFLARSVFFRRADSLVTINEDHQFVRQDEQLMMAELDRNFRFEKPSGSKDNPHRTSVTDVPLLTAKHLVKAYASQFPDLRAVVTAPILVPRTGRLIDKTGYDAETSLWVHVPEDWPGIPDVPTPSDVEAALTRLWWPVHQFPFASAVDDTVMLTAMLTAVVRPLLPMAPGFAFDAPTQATGKTLLIKVTAALGGYSPAISAQPDSRNDEELRKRLFALLLGGQGAIVIDNIVGEFDSPALATLLTSEQYSDRVLGESRAECVPSAALVLLSGNNLSLKGDLSRRFLRCRIDTGVENPHARSFQFDPLEIVKTHRSHLVAAALTLLKAHLAAATATPNGKGRIASFEVWDDLVRQAVCGLAILQKAGLMPPGGKNFPRLVDPIEAIDQAVHQDPGRSLLARLLRAWANEVGTGNGSKTIVSVKELILISAPKQRGANVSAVVVPPANEPPLNEVLTEIAGNAVTGAINGRSLGKTLAKYKDRVIEDRALRLGDPYQGAATWWVEEVGDCGGFGGDVSPRVSTDQDSASNKRTTQTKPTKSTKVTKSAHRRG